MTATEPTRKSSALLVVGAWLVVLLPAAWGLSYTVRNAVKIFVRPEASAAPSQAPAK
jgi:hypothetical protein